MVNVRDEDIVNRRRWGKGARGGAESAAMRRRGIAVEHVGIEVGAVRPDDRSQFVIHAYLPEELRIEAERLEDGSPQLSFEIDLAHRAVVEAEPEDERS